MSALQKVIKYGAIAFGFYLVFVILSVIISVIIAIFGISMGIDAYKTNYSENESSVVAFDETYENVRNMNIKLDVSKLNIKTGEKLKVEVTNPTNEFYCKMEGDTLKIRDKRSGFNFLNFTDEVIPEIVIYIPKNQELEDIKIENGVNESYIEKLVAEEIDIQTGVGKFIVGDISADILNINGGAGEAVLEKSTVNELKLEAGVGKFVINSEIQKEAKVEAGVGQLIVNLQGGKDKYKVKTSTGLGGLFVDNKKVGDDQVVGDGDCYIKVEAGVGEVRVNFLDKE